MVNDKKGSDKIAVACYHAFDLAIIFVDKQSAVFIHIERFSLEAFADRADTDPAVQCAGKASPFAEERLGLSFQDHLIPAFELLQKHRKELGPVHFMTEFIGKGGHILGKIRHDFFDGDVHVHADADKTVSDNVCIRGKFKRGAGDFFVTDEHVVWPLDQRRELELMTDRSGERDGGRGHYQKRLIDMQFGHDDDRRPDPAFRRHPDPVHPAKPAGLLLGDQHGARLDLVADFMHHLPCEGVGRRHLPEVVHLLTDDFGPEMAFHLVREEEPGAFFQRIAGFCRSIDDIPHLTQKIDIFPDSGPGDAQAFTDDGSGDRLVYAGFVQNMQKIEYYVCHEGVTPRWI